MRRILLVLLGLIVTGSVFGQTKVTVYADDGYFPYSYMEGTSARGAYIDIVLAAAAQLKGYTVEIVPLPWKRCLNLMERGEAFAILPPYKRPGLRPWMDYQLKLYDEKIVLFLNAQGPKMTRWPQDFVGKTVGEAAGWANLDAFRGQVKIEFAQSNKIGLLKLEAKRNDAYLMDETVGLLAIKELRAAGAINAKTSFVIGPTVSTEEAFLSLTNVATAKFPFKNDFAKQMQGILGRMTASGEIKKIVANYTN
ncbi:MAG: transporter substrate-binding domain-containing protein [Spirochaetales bacterium]